MLQDGADVTPEHGPADDRFLVLRADGAFESGGDPYGPNAGRWSVDPETGELWIDSDAGEDDDWIVAVRADTMTWRGTRGFGRAFTLVHARAAG